VGRKGERSWKKGKEKEPFFPLLSPHHGILRRYGIFNLFPLRSHLTFNSIANYLPSGIIFFLLSAVRYEEIFYYVATLQIVRTVSFS